MSLVSVNWSTHKVSGVHDAILHGVSAVQGELQHQLLPLPTLLPDHLLLLARESERVSISVTRVRTRYVKYTHIQIRAMCVYNLTITTMHRRAAALPEGSTRHNSK